jgi:adenosylhomocysteine nucleosidase
MSGQSGVVAVTCLALEASIARGPGVSVLCNPSMGLRAALAAAIARGATGIISFGIAGGLAPELVAGDWVVASAVRKGATRIATDRAWALSLLDSLPGAVHADVAGTDTVVADPDEKSELFHTSGAVAVDMESHIAAQVAAEHRVPFVACRVIIDAAHRALPPAATLGLRADGKPNVPAIFRSVCREPRQIPDLVRTAFDARIAERALRQGRRRLGVGLGFPDYKGFAFRLAYA